MSEDIEELRVLIGQHSSMKTFYIGKLDKNGHSLTGIYLSTDNEWVRYNGSLSQNIFFNTYQECLNILKDQFDLIYIETHFSLKVYENDATHDKQTKNMS